MPTRPTHYFCARCDAYVPVAAFDAHAPTHANGPRRCPDLERLEQRLAVLAVLEARGTATRPTTARNLFVERVLPRVAAHALRGLALEGDAVFDGPGQEYRYMLSRYWAPGPVLLWVLYNPSRANAVRADATLRRCLGFARAAGFGTLLVGNLYAFVATKPGALTRRARAGHPVVGPANDAWLAAMAATADAVAVGWGGLAAKDDLRVRAVLAGPLAGRPLLALNATADGHPVHPLRRPKTEALAPWYLPRR